MRVYTSREPVDVLETDGRYLARLARAGVVLSSWRTRRSTDQSSFSVPRGALRARRALPRAKRRRILGLDVETQPEQSLPRLRAARAHAIALAHAGPRSGLFEAFASVIPLQKVSPTPESPSCPAVQSFGGYSSRRSSLPHLSGRPSSGEAPVDAIEHAA